MTLACWRISRRPPSDTYPWGYGKSGAIAAGSIVRADAPPTAGKFETFGTLSVSIILGERPEVQEQI